MADDNAMVYIYQETNGTCALTGKTGKGVPVSIPSAGIERLFVHWSALKKVVQSNASAGIMAQLANRRNADDDNSGSLPKLRKAASA